MIFYILSIVAVLLFLAGLGIIDISNIKNGLIKVMKKKPEPQQDNSGIIAEIKEAVSQVPQNTENQPYLSRRHTESYMKLRKALDVFPSVDYLPMVFRLNRHMREINEYRPIEGKPFGRLDSAVYAYILESYARSFDLKPDEKYKRFLAAANFWALAAGIDHIIDNGNGKDFSEFVDTLYNSFTGEPKLRKVQNRSVPAIF